jgi:hypothetical protein
VIVCDHREDPVALGIGSYSLMLQNAPMPRRAPRARGAFGSRTRCHHPSRR